MSLVGVTLLGNTFQQDPNPKWVKINNVAIGESQQYGYSTANSNGDIGGLLSKLSQDPKVVVVIYNWTTNIAYTKSGFNLTVSGDYALANGYTTFVLNSKVPLFYNPTHIPAPTPKALHRISVYVMPGSELMTAAMQNVSFKPSFTLAFWNSNGWDSGNPDQNVLSAVRNNGGSLTISYGGAAGCSSPTGENNSGGEPALLGGTPQQVMQRYLQPIQQYGFNYADFDIEGGYENDSSTYTLRNASIALLQKQLPNLKVSFTVPGSLDCVNMIQDALNQGVKIDTVNLMVMDYYQPTDLVSAAIQNLQNAHNKFPSLNLGVIPLLGVNDDKINTYTLQNHKDLISQIQSLGMTYVTVFSFWALNIDTNFQYLQAYSAVF